MPDEFIFFKTRYLFINRVFYNSVGVCWHFIGAFSLGDLRGLCMKRINTEIPIYPIFFLFANR
jgi:hypothetical protein